LGQKIFSYGLLPLGQDVAIIYLSRNISSQAVAEWLIRRGWGLLEYYDDPDCPIVVLFTDNLSPRSFKLREMLDEFFRVRIQPILDRKVQAITPAT